MSKQFILAFGGTGARCIEAFLYLMASGAVTKPTHILLIDPDSGHGNLANTTKQLNRYQLLHKQLDAETNASSLFGTPLNPAVQGDSATTDPFFWEYPDGQQQFRTLVEYQQLSPELKGLVELLYDDSDLNMRFDQGYVGRAHLGSIDQFRTLSKHISAQAASGSDSQNALRLFIKRLRSAAETGNEDVGLFVVGSIFGGTGASGLPAVPPLLDEVFSGHDGLRGKVRVGACFLTPYFTFPKSEDASAPESQLHPLATQAALQHYAESDTGYDWIYVLGAPKRPTTNSENHKGGGSQRNSCHYVELSAALAADDFFRRSKDGQVRVAYSGAEQVSWGKLPVGQLKRLREHVTKLGIAALMHQRFFHDDLEKRRHVGARWVYDLENKSSGRTLIGDENELEELKSFSERFLTWMAELRGEDAALIAPGLFHAVSLSEPEGHVNTDDEDLLRLGGRVELDGRQPRGALYNDFVGMLNEKLPVDQRTGVGWYLQALSATAQRFYATHYAS